MPDLLSYRSRSLGSPGTADVQHIPSGTQTKEAWNNTSKTWGAPTTFAFAARQADSHSSQVTGSMSHKRGSDGKYHSGGPFYTQINGRKHGFVTCDKTIVFTKVLTGIANSRCKQGGVAIRIPASLLSSFEKSNTIPSRSKDLSDLDAYGATAISACSPANPASEVGTGVSELYHEGLPSLPGIRTWKQRTSVAKSAGDEYLNQVFGWVPLVSEVDDFTSVVRRHRDILNQYSRNAGSLVHRRFNFPVESSESSEVIGEGRAEGPLWVFGGAGALTPEADSELPKVSITRGTKVKRWFSGAFTFSVPSQSDSWQRALGYGSDADILFGASLNPELLWNLTPWSWAVDWFSNTGDVINNISNYVRAGQVMQYGYVMEERTSFVRLSMSGSGYPGIPTPAPIEYYCTSKGRRPANPYGFGIDVGDLSPTQLAIVAALGITLL